MSDSSDDMEAYSGFCDEYEDVQLTKLEKFSAMAMQGLLANSYMQDASSEDIAKIAVNQAVQLIKALAKANK